MDAHSLIQRFSRMESDRGIWDAHFHEIGQYVLPRSDWFRNGRTPGDKHTEQLFDSTATLALERFAAACESMVVPRTQVWHQLSPRHEMLAEIPKVKMWCEEVTKILFKQRYSPRGNFASQASDVFTSLGAFGTGAMYIDEEAGHGCRYRSVHLSEIYIAENHQGIIDTVFRKFPFTARQAVQRWGKDAVSDRVAKNAEDRPDAVHEFLHAVYPNTERITDRKDYKGMAVASCYVDLMDKKVVHEGGYHAMPYAVSRYLVGPKEVYGRSPAMTALADIKTINAMSRTVLRAGEMAVSPPILLQEDGVLGVFNLRPGALNFGGLNEQGVEMARPFNSGSRVDIGEEQIERRRKTVNDAFLVTLFQILVEAPTMTATEAMLRAQEKGQLLAPTMGRLQSEFLGPLIEREMDILLRNGMLPPMPEVLLMSGGEMDIEYTSPLNKAQRAEEGVAILRTVESIAPIAQIDPTVMDIFDHEAMVRELAEINGVPMKLLRTPEQMAAIKDQRAQAAQAQQLLQAAPVAASSIKDLAQAQAMAGAVPSQQVPNIFGGGGL